jgi:hypothetical protein
MKEQMLIPEQSVVVVRDGKQVVPPVGEPFGFTDDEIADVRRAEQITGSVILRKPINEMSKAEEQAKARAEKALADLVKKAENAEAAAAKKNGDKALAEAAVKAKEAVRAFATEKGLAIPAGYEAADL